MHPYYDDGRSFHYPNTQPSSYGATIWPHGTTAQQYGMDPRVYSDSGAHPGNSQYAGNPYGVTSPTTYPTSAPQGSYTDPSAQYPSAYPSYQQQTLWQQPTTATHDPYSAQHASLNANPGSAPVFLYPPSHAGPPMPHSGPFAGYQSMPSTYAEDADDLPGHDPSGRTREWSQHLTLQGAPRERIAVACDRCRVRKMKCDGVQPACSNCQRAAHQGVVCRYEPEPGRRGPDQAQRVRSPPGQRKPRRSAAQRGQEDAAAESVDYGW